MAKDGMHDLSILEEKFKKMETKKPQNTLENHKREKIEDTIIELGEIFDAIIGEIEEREQYFQEVEDIGANDLMEKTKREIVERVAELQKITELINGEKAKLNDL